MGLELRNPIIVSASPLTNTIENIRTCEKEGAGALVFQSLFEEQILNELDVQLDKDEMYFWYPKAAEQIKSITKNQLIRSYLNRIEQAKEEVSIPVIASVNCFSAGEWISFSKEIENAGADALELNIATHIPHDHKMDGRQLEENHIQIVRKVKEQINIPVAVKIAPFYTNIIDTTLKMEKAGADALVLFNRFYLHDIDIDNISVESGDYFSQPSELLPVLRWVGILSDKLTCDIAATTGIHDYQGAVKQLLAGANAAQVCSVLYEKGLGEIRVILHEMKAWMEKKRIHSVTDLSSKIMDDRIQSAKFEQLQFIRKNTA